MIKLQIGPQVLAKLIMDGKYLKNPKNIKDVTVKNVVVRDKHIKVAYQCYLVDNNGNRYFKNYI